MQGGKRKTSQYGMVDIELTQFATLDKECTKVYKKKYYISLFFAL